MPVVVSAFKLSWWQLMFDHVLQCQTLGANDLSLCVSTPNLLLQHVPCGLGGLWPLVSGLCVKRRIQHSLEALILRDSKFLVKLWQGNIVLTGVLSWVTSGSTGDVLIAWKNLVIKGSRKAQLKNRVGGKKRESERETYFAERMKEKKQNSSHW